MWKLCEIHDGTRAKNSFPLDIFRGIFHQQKTDLTSRLTSK